ncbi:arylamine N-acetyltransferase family protein [Natronobacterium texcoconense]|uniref:N-hydroxyarylamine O-acetyltransferase n=1 Tax=Natronobacterium texcoconense TaxID=1095778 RepID=A0A1H1IQN2_NATTX|nr:arylamine N-acetyltransferase [Natronobacterium texcoconense]SDR40007.1 N-hydroxyarylamine O-acetyltransferase [Natronobacterium texcoconense]
MTDLPPCTRVESGVDLSVEAYVERIGLEPETIETPNLETLERLQRAHVTSVPFENLDIVGGLDGRWETRPVTLSIPRLYEKIVSSNRGGYCFELNGLFHWLLDELGFEVDRVAARVVTESNASPPANHHANVVHLDRRYVVDVGMGTPVMRRPTPLDGSTRTDEAGVEWRVTECDWPSETHQTAYCPSQADEWTTRYVFDDEPRDLRYFEATNDYLQQARESPFTGDPIVSIATDDGHRKLTGETLLETIRGDEREQPIADDEWQATLARAFGLRLDRDSP